MGGALYVAGCAAVGSGLAMGWLSTRRESARLALTAFLTIIAGVVVSCIGVSLDAPK